MILPPKDFWFEYGGLVNWVRASVIVVVSLFGQCIAVVTLLRWIAGGDLEDARVLPYFKIFDITFYPVKSEVSTVERGFDDENYMSDGMSQHTHTSREEGKKATQQFLAMSTAFCPAALDASTTVPRKINRSSSATCGLSSSLPTTLRKNWISQWFGTPKSALTKCSCLTNARTDALLVTTRVGGDDMVG